jgi:hypothetical protein
VFTTVKVVPVIVNGAIASLNVAVICVFFGTLGVGPGLVVAGTVSVTVGLVVSGASQRPPPPYSPHPVIKKTFTININTR